MVQIIRILFAHPALFCLHLIRKRPKLSITILAVLSILFFSSNYISDRLPGMLWDMSGNTEEKNIEERVEKVVIKKGDTLTSILRKQKLPASDIITLCKLASSEKATSILSIGKVLNFYYDVEIYEQEESDLVEERSVLNRMALTIDNSNSIEFVRQGDDFVLHKITSPLKKMLSKYDATVSTSIIASLQKAGMNTSIVIKLINAYSYQIDLQREIRTGDKITVIAEKFVTQDNQFSHHGKILYASLTSKGTDYNIYLYSPSGSEHEQTFFSDNGQSIKGTLLKTPLDVVRISSHFGYRKKHPVLGFGRMHKGVDFAASTGTPIYSAGDGVIKFIGWKSGYGRFVLVKHPNNLETAYAHASKFAKNLKVGSRIKQGQIIAYVGSSGHATGPHLHYEVRISGKQINPVLFKSTPGVKLTGTKLANFNLRKKRLIKLANELTEKTEISAEEVKGINL
jgi:murein DD-endopeptidase MepM/ murein hydrolase activator NlpD